MMKAHKCRIFILSIARSSPYRGYNDGVTRLIPAITYTGDRFQIFGPYAQVGIVGSCKLRLAATGAYRIGVYEESESDFLKGMGDRKSTFMAGLAVQAELPGGVDLSAGYAHDVLDRIGGETARLALDKSFQFGVFRFSPEIGLNWLSSDLSNYDFGVPAGSFKGNNAILSGPAGGVVGYAMTTWSGTGKKPVIGFDMGGTSTDVSRFGGDFERVHEIRTAGVRIQAPQMHIKTVAAGGGSRLFFRNNMFVVGPESAGSQGCMNNLTFGNENFGYYETIGGGAGAGPSWNGCSGVHTHMTNTRITDPEILERRYPVMLNQFCLRKNSGGKGKYNGGDGLVREMEFLEDMNVAILSERRVFSPYGLAGGAPGKRGKNIFQFADGRQVSLGGKNEISAKKGDRILILTPGGGGYGEIE